MSRNVYELLFNGNSAAKTEPFLTVPGGLTYTFGQLDRRSAAIATVLSQLGLEPGDRVASQVAKSPDAVALYLGCLRGGFVFVPLSSELGVEDTGYYLGDCEPKLFVCNETDIDRLKPVADIVGVDLVQTLSPTSTGSLADAANEAHPLAPVCARSANDPAVIIYTAGTTNRAKGAIITHENLIANTRALHAIWRWRPGDVMLHTLSISSAFGLFVGIHTSLLNSSEIIFAPEFSVDIAETYLPGSSVFMETPEHLSELVSSEGFNSQTFAKLRLLVSGNAYLSVSTFADYLDKADLGLTECYLATETGVIASNPPESERIGGSVGFALPNVSMRIISPDGNAQPAGEIGEVQIKGPSLFAGYWSNPEASDAAFTSDGYFHTGDVGFVEPDGRLTLAGRVNDMMSVQGATVYPREIEVVVESIAGVRDVIAIGLPHPTQGAAIAVFVVSDPEVTEEMVAETLENSIDKRKLPQKYMFVADLPKSALGVVQRTQIRKKFADLFLDGSI